MIVVVVGTALQPDATDVLVVAHIMLPELTELQEIHYDREF